MADSSMPPNTLFIKLLNVFFSGSGSLGLTVSLIPIMRHFPGTFVDGDALSNRKPLFRQGSDSRLNCFFASMPVSRLSSSLVR